MGLRVVATGRRRDPPPELFLPEVTYRPADLSADPLRSLAAGIDAVFHLAALSSPWGKVADFTAANVTATHRLLDAARAAHSSAFVHVSTPSIYAEARHRFGLTESSSLPSRWPNNYVRTKFTAERLVVAAASSELATVVLRPRALVSPFDTVLLPRLLRAARGGTLVLPGGGEAMVELTDARDVVSALLAAHERACSVSGEAFNVSGGQPLPLARVAKLVFGALGRPLRVRSVDARIALAVAALAEKAAALWPGCPEPPLTRYGAMVAGWSQTFDLTAARTRLGWTPQHAPEAAIAWAMAGKQHA